MGERILIMAPCPECGVGSIFAVRNKKDSTLCLYCEECDTLWKKPSDIAQRNYYENSNADFEWGGYATLEEVIEFGWEDYIYIFEDCKLVKYTDKKKGL